MSDSWVRNKSDEKAIELGCYFDKEKAEHICEFFETFLCVSTGRLAGKPLKLIPWQRDYLSRLNGWRRPDGSRRFRRAFLGISKKAGKSFLQSGIALYFGLADGCSQPEIVIAASSRDQAAIIYREAKNMVLASPQIKKICRVVDSRKRIELPSASGYIAVISSDARRSEGINASAILVDETHVWYGTELYDALKYAGIARDDSIMMETTTAGSDRDSFCHYNWRRAQAVIRGDEIDVDLLPIVYTAEGMPMETEEECEAAIKAANPSVGYVLSMEEFKSSMAEAKQSPIKWQAFLRYRTGCWVNSDKAWLDMDKWDKCTQGLDPATLKGKVCYGGLDLSHKKDLTAFVLYFPEEEAVIPFAWTTRDQVNHRKQKNKASYLQFIEDGELLVVDGGTIDENYVFDKILELAKVYNLKSIAYDPFCATQISLKLEGEGMDMASFRQGFLSLSEPTKKLEEMVLNEEIEHFNNGLLRWCASNVVIQEDPAGNIKPNKDKSNEMIDPIAALICALGLAGVSYEKQTESVYEERGALVF